MSLRKKATAGFFWSFLERFGIQVVVFVVSIVLARVLSPAEFGLIGMLAVFMAIGQTLIDGGLTQSLIRSENLTQADYSTVFFFNVFGSVVIYLLLFVTAPYIAEFYRQPLLKDLTRIYCLSFVINSFSAVQLTRLSKTMDFKTQMIVSVPSQVISGIAGIIFAFLGFGVWSLVYMNLIQSILNTGQLWWRSGWTPSFIFDRKRFKYHFSFGYKLGVSSLLATVFSNLYPIIIGRYFSAVDLGYYSRAGRLKNLPVENLSTALNKVTYPLFASIQKESARLKNVYKTIMQTVTFVIAPALVLLSVLAEPLVVLLLTEKWLPVVPYLQVMCFTGILTPIHSYNLNILKVKGRSDLFLRLEILKRIILVATIFISIQFGIMGLIWGQLIDSIIFLFINSFYSGKFIDYRLREQFADLLPSLLLAFATGVFVYFVNSILRSFGTIELIRLFGAGIIGIGFYASVANFFKMEAFIYIKNVILKK